MREIKFRARDGSRFYYFVMNQIWDLQARKLHNELCLDGVNFEQFTGLKDKNGREIYEGDILEAKNTIAKDHLRFCMKWDFERGSWTTFLPRDAFEIIGNIHENQELLS